MEVIMVIDRASFIELAGYLESASEEVLSLTKVFAAWAEQVPTSTETHEFLPIVNHLEGVNAALSKMEQMMRALLVANQEEGKFQRHKSQS